MASSESHSRRTRMRRKLSSFLAKKGRTRLDRAGQEKRQRQG
jgi:hypothetical protein